MRRRKTQGRFNETNGVSPLMRNRNLNDMTQLFHVKGKRPAARDGHTGLVFGDHLIVFGGDRHHMPFNDTYVFHMGNEV